MGNNLERVEEVEEEPNDQQQQQAPALLLTIARFLWRERVALLLLLILLVLLAQYGYWHSVAPFSDCPQTGLDDPLHPYPGTASSAVSSSNISQTADARGQ
uniref:Uncharacterized protein n=1 Tax=Globodera rostochiensis TaxID=31243 RepID=A0A914I3D7_GLORO